MWRRCWKQVHRVNKQHHQILWIGLQAGCNQTLGSVKLRLWNIHHSIPTSWLILTCGTCHSCAWALLTLLRVPTLSVCPANKVVVNLATLSLVWSSDCLCFFCTVGLIWRIFQSFPENKFILTVGNKNQNSDKEQFSFRFARIDSNIYLVFNMCCAAAFFLQHGLQGILKQTVCHHIWVQIQSDELLWPKKQQNK